MSDDPAASPLALGDKEQGHNYAIDLVHVEWDNMPEVRRRLREKNHLFMHWDREQCKLTNNCVDKTLANVRENRVQLRPLLHRMRDNNLHLPLIDSVIEEIRSLYMATKMCVSYDLLYQQSWACRRLLSLAKNTVLHRKYLSEESLYHFCACFTTVHAYW